MHHVGSLFSKSTLRIDKISYNQFLKLPPPTGLQLYQLARGNYVMEIVCIPVSCAFVLRNHNNVKFADHKKKSSLPSSFKENEPTIFDPKVVVVKMKLKPVVCGPCRRRSLLRAWTLILSELHVCNLLTSSIVLQSY